MSLQHTLAQPFTLTGKGLHTGLNITALFLPAEANTGIRFQRADMPGHPVIPALASQVSATERGTVIMKDNAQVSTIEHCMSALMAHGIDNCLIQVNAPEVPILDGSANYVVQAINKAGVKEQNAEREAFVVTEPMEFEANGSKIRLEPADSFQVEATIQFDSPILGTQTATLDDMKDFDSQISHARTFVFVREIAPLLKMGLIKGGDLDNAIVIYDQLMEQAQIDELCQLLNVPSLELNEVGYLNKRPLSFDNEPARHKLLDLIGDLSLIGRPIVGKVTALRPGHGFNTQVAKALLNKITK